jgi:hypothetical protein
MSRSVQLQDSSVSRRPVPRRRRTVLWGAVIAFAGAPIFLAGTPGLARAATSSTAATSSLPKNLQKFSHCPVSNPAVTTCLFSSTYSTTFVIGSTTVSSTEPSTINLGLIVKPSGKIIPVLPTDGSSAMVAKPVDLPGGLTGIPGAPAELDVTATPQLVGMPSINLDNLVTTDGVGLALPIDMLVGTPTGILGSDCTIADAATPISLELTTGTTNPPSPNKPIKGSPGTLSSTDQGILTDHHLLLVDNSFAVPGADNCGPDGAFDEILDLDKGLPSAAGSNSAVLGGNSYTAPASLIRKYLG